MITNNYLEKLKPNQIFDMAEFVVSENFNHHNEETNTEDYSSEVNTIYDEELTYFNNSSIYVGRDSQGFILGTIRVMKWNYIDPLPLQKIFVINPMICVDLSKVNGIYHIGRFAIQKAMPSLQLFKQLVICAITPICKHKRNVAFAECDVKLLRILSMLGIKFDIIGKSLNYLGSETIPILLNYNGLIDFYKRHQSIITRDVLKIPKKNYVESLAI